MRLPPLLRNTFAKPLHPVSLEVVTSLPLAARQTCSRHSPAAARAGSMNSAAAAVSLWSLVVLGSAASWADVPDVTQQSFIDRCVKEHNRARSSVQPAATNMKDMVGRAGHSGRSTSLTSVAGT